MLDETYQNYVNRVANLSLRATHETQLNNIQKSAKFEQGQPVYFPGYSLMTPVPADDPLNQNFYQQLAGVVQQLEAKLPPQFFVSLPLSSFHLTVADLIWDDAYEAAIKADPDYEQKLAEAIKNSFTEYQHLEEKGGKKELQLMGLTIFPRAIALCLVPKSEQEYQQLNQLRRCVYQNPEVIGLSIEQQYPYTAHITLGYFGELAHNFEREAVLDTLAAINDQWIAIEPPVLAVDKVQLRKFDNMLDYYRQPDWPELQF